MAGTAAPGDAVQLGVGLLLLGLGWSCGLIAGSTLVTESVGPDLRPTAQGGTDLLMGLGAALAGVVGGPLLAVGGFGLVAAVSAALVLPLVVVWIAARRARSAVPVVPDQQDDADQQRQGDRDLQDVSQRPSPCRESWSERRPPQRRASRGLASGCAPAGVLVPARSSVRVDARPERGPRPRLLRARRAHRGRRDRGRRCPCARSGWPSARSTTCRRRSAERVRPRVRHPAVGTAACRPGSRTGVRPTVASTGRAALHRSARDPKTVGASS